MRGRRPTEIGCGRQWESARRRTCRRRRRWRSTRSTRSTLWLTSVRCLSAASSRSFFSRRCRFPLKTHNSRTTTVSGVGIFNSANKRSLVRRGINRGWSPENSRVTLFRHRIETISQENSVHVALTDGYTIKQDPRWPCCPVQRHRSRKLGEKKTPHDEIVAD